MPTWLQFAVRQGPATAWIGFICQHSPSSNVDLTDDQRHCTIHILPESGPLLVWPFTVNILDMGALFFPCLLDNSQSIELFKLHLKCASALCWIVLQCKAIWVLIVNTPIDTTILLTNKDNWWCPLRGGWYNYSCFLHVFPRRTFYFQLQHSRERSLGACYKPLRYHCGFYTSISNHLNR